MNIGILEDEEIWRNRIRKCIVEEYGEKYGEKHIETYEKSRDFLNVGCNNDIVLIDVELNDGNGLNICKKYTEKKSKGIAILVSSHEELCKEGYKLNAFRFADKYNLQEELKEALNAAVKILKSRYKITIHITGVSDVQIDVSDILYIETEGRHIYVHTDCDIYRCTNTIKELADKLLSRGFYQPYRSYIVNLDKIKTFKDAKVVMSDGTDIIVSLKKFTEIKRIYTERIFEKQI